MPDKLTGLAAYDELAPRVDGKTTTAILLDVNSLRFLNALFGHEVADRAIVAVANALRDFCEGLPQSALFRIWGDEFLLLLSSAHEIQALDIAAALVDEIHAQNIAYSRPDHPEMDRLAVSAVVFNLEAQEARAMTEGGPSRAFRDRFETLLYKEKLRSSGGRGVVVDARTSTDDGAN